MNNPTPSTISRKRRAAAWSVHFFTATGAVFGLLALVSIHQQKFILAFWLMGGAIFVDAVDGLFARMAQTKVAAPQVDGAMMDNILDYLNYAIVPVFLLIVAELLPFSWGIVAGCAIALASAYQFSQTEAKTDDHFFTGFPSYWNLVIFYMFLWQLPPLINLIIIFTFIILVFIPIKYVYLSRLDYLTHSGLLKGLMLMASILWAVSAMVLLWRYPETDRFWVAYSIGFFVLYGLVSLYRTFVPLKKA